MPSLKEFVAALQAGWFPALAALVGCSIIILGDFHNVPYLSSTPHVVLTAAVVVGVFAFSILSANLAFIPIKLWNAHTRRKAEKEFRERLEKEIENAPEPEQKVLAHLVTSGRRAFAAEFNDQKFAPLVTKGIVRKLGGAHSVLEWPYEVRQEAWDYLLESRERFQVDIHNNTHNLSTRRNRGW